ncbi:mediator of RNA polymerase II transcription subunit 31 isoform X2 [Acomys russatus]|uniref:mediator of RNA polymerase II transcription subunit 31 isoform X2 n=1 Tax=Acomys russatus TaxID=60746 RepID=UPI0021E2FD31|nr:mediator of RNA polymerase II transcription subunit 31 isoform X2 [Acomys russatus]
MAAAVAMETDDAGNRLRFQLELEFVQCLANPNYLNFLAQRGYFKDKAFVNYLKYLLYWKEPEYAKYLKRSVKEGIRSRGRKLKVVASHCVVLGSKLGSSARSARTVNR